MLKKVAVYLCLCSFLSMNSCAATDATSEVKVEPTTVFAAIQTAIAVVQAVHERNTAVNQNDINTIIRALDHAKLELMAHQDNRIVQEWVNSVSGLELTFERYPTIRRNTDQLDAFLRATEASFVQLEAIFRDLPVQATYKAALAFNTVAAMRMVALGDHPDGLALVKAFSKRIVKTNERLLSIPAFPAHTYDANGHMTFENCKVLTEPFKVDLRDHVMYSAFAEWSMGYHKKNEFRYYKHRLGKHMGSCFEDKNGNNALRHMAGPWLLANSWRDIAPKMWDENVQAMQREPIYNAVLQSNNALKDFQTFFVKSGNNGTVSCDTYCEGAQWGQVGSCIGAIQASNGYQLACSAVPAFNGHDELTCQCTP